MTRSTKKTEQPEPRAIKRTEFEAWLAKAMYMRGIGSLRSTQAAAKDLTEQMIKAGLVQVDA